MTEDPDQTYRNREWFKEKYVEEELTLGEMSEQCPGSESTLSKWARRFGFSDRGVDHDLSDVDIPDTEPWKDESLLRELYHEKQLSTTDISIALNCSSATVNTWMDKLGVEKRRHSAAMQNSHGLFGHASFYTTHRGREVWKSGDKIMLVHRLVAVAKFGIEKVGNHHVHHINENSWDNRPENLELVENREHQKMHLKVDGLDRIRVAELYENGDASSRDLAEILDYDIRQNTVINIHNEFYGGDSVAV